MNIRSTARGPTASEDAEASTRLRAITGRGRAEQASYPIQELPEAYPEKQRALRLFWTPEEAAALGQ